MFKNNHLFYLYVNWKENPKLYEKELAETIDKIIYSTLRTQSVSPIYKRIEDRDDLIQELRVLCVQKLNYISNPTNKRIFNFLRVSIKYALKDKAKKVGKFLDREIIEHSLLGEKVKQASNLFCFGDTMLDNVATLLAYGDTKQKICSQLGLTRTELNRIIDKLKDTYNDKEYV